MKRLSGCFLLLLLCVLHVPAEAATYERPRFTWNTMQFFWNKQCVLGAEIKSSEKKGSTYLVPFGASTVLTVYLEGDVVRELEARFVYTGEPEVNGKAFMRLQESLIRVGTYRWPSELRREVSELFRDMSPQPRVYQRRTSRFERRQDGNDVWVMALRFVDAE